LLLLAVSPLVACGESGDDGVTDGGGPTPVEPDAAESVIPCAPSGVSKGPWSLGMTRTGGKIRWEACRDDAVPGVILTPEGGGAEIRSGSVAREHTIVQRRRAPLNASAPDDAPGTVFTHEAVLTTLTPGTCYRYRLAADAALEGRFCTARPDGGTVHFLTIADTNPLLGPATRNVLDHVLPRSPDFTMHAGDVQYYDSFVETWAGWFPAMRPLLGQGAMLVALGNHELENDGEDYDDYNYRFFGDEAQGGRDAYFHFESGGVHFFALNSELPLAPESAEGSWLVSTLAAASASPGYRTSLIFMHRPWVTCGDSEQDVDLRTRYASIFVQNKVSVVFQAHVHAYERFTLDGLTWITTGGGGGLLDDIDQNASRSECASRKASGSFFHAVDVVVEGMELRGTTIDDRGAARDTFTVPLP